MQTSQSFGVAKPSWFPAWPPFRAIAVRIDRITSSTLHVRCDAATQDWRDAVREETSAAVRASPGLSGSDGGGRANTRGGGIGVGLAHTGGISRGGSEGAQDASSGNTNKNGPPGGEGAGLRGADLSMNTVKSSAGAGGVGDARDKVRGYIIFLVRLHRSYAA